MGNTYCRKPNRVVELNGGIMASVFGISSSAVKEVRVIWIAEFLKAGVQHLRAVKYILPPACSAIAFRLAWDNELILEQLIFSYCYGNIGSVSGDNFAQCFFSAKLFLFSHGSVCCFLNLERQGESMRVVSVGNINYWCLVKSLPALGGAAPERRWIPFGESIGSRKRGRWGLSLTMCEPQQIYPVAWSFAHEINFILVQSNVIN